MKLHPLIALLFTAANLVAETPPPNDDLVNAIDLTGDSFTHTTDVSCAGLAPDEPAFRRFTGPINETIFSSLTPRTVWWRWQSPDAPASKGIQIDLTTSAPPSTSLITHIEVFERFGPEFNSLHIDYPGLAQPFIALPNKNYYIRGFYSPDPETTQPENVTLTISGQTIALAANRGIENSIPMTGNAIPQVYAHAYTFLHYTWTPDSTGFPVLENESPIFARAIVYPEGESFNALEGPVIAGEKYTVSFYTSSTTQSPVQIGGNFAFLPPASNSTFETRKPVIEIPRNDRIELSLTATDHGREFWWTFTPTVDGILKTTTSSSRPFLQPKVFEGEQNTSVLPNINSTVQVTANTTYVISLRTNTGEVTSDIDQLFAFYPSADSVTISDTQLGIALRQAFNLPPDIPIPQAFFTDLSSLTVRAFRDCDDDDCGPPGITISNLEGLENAHSLTRLHLKGGELNGHEVSSLAPIKGLTKLETLRLPNALKGTAEELRSAVEDLSELTQLHWLSLEQNSLKDNHLEPISALTRLETLDIDDNLISDLSPISGLTLIERLDIDDNPLIDLSPLSSLQSLRNLDLNPLHNGLTSLPPLRDLRVIKVISDDLGPLARHSKLRYIDIPNSSKFGTPSRLRDLTPIANIPTQPFVHEDHFSNALRDFRPLALMEFENPSMLTSVLSNIVQKSKADLSDPETAALFAEANLNPSSILLMPDDPSLLIPDGKLRWFMSNRPPNTQTTDPTQAQLDSLTYLYGTHVESIVGIDNAVNLKTLILIDGWISDLTPLSGLSDLSTLNLQNNFISDVSPIAALTDVVIDVRGNPIDPSTIPSSWIDNPLVHFDPLPEQDPAEDIPDPTLRSLIRIALGMKPNAPLVSADLESLRTLHADLADIRSLDGLEAATNLVGLSLRNNILTDLAPIPSDKLRWLRVSGNPLSAASLSLLSNLEGQGVIVDNNEETRFLSAITPSSNVVFADNYQLPLVRYLQLFPEVTTLFLSNNYLTTIPELADLPNLETVYLEGNLLMLGEDDPAGQIVAGLRSRGVAVHTGEQAPATSGEIVVDQAELREATADGLNLPYIPPTFTQAQLDTIINFDWENSVRDVLLEDPAFISQMTNLEFLSLENSGLTDISFLETLTKLQRLDLDFNKINDIQALENMTDLRELDINNNQLTDISVIANFPKLISLDLDHNCISSIQSLSGLSELLDLELHFNKISDVTPLGGLDNLEWINIHSNGIDYTQPNQAAVFSNLEFLIEYPFLYPQYFVQPQLTVSGTDVQLNWTAEKNTYYQVLYSSNLEGPFIHILNVSSSSTSFPAEFVHNAGTSRGFYKFIAIPNPYR